MSQKLAWFTRAVSGLTAAGILTVAGVAHATVPTLSQSNVTVGIGQSTSVSSTNSTNLYLGYNPSPTVVGVSMSGAQATVTGLAPGSAGITVCAVGTASDCTTLNVIVQTASVSGISFSSNNFSLGVGSNQSVTVSGGTGAYTISSNSNTSVVSASLSGTSLSVTGSSAGVASISVCDSSGHCGTLAITVTSSNTSSTSGLSFSSNNFSLTVGSTQNVTISGGNGAYSIFSNSNASAAPVGMTNGNTVVVNASNAGTAAIKICDSTNLCGTLTVTLTGVNASNQAVTFNPASPTVAVGQTLSVTLSSNSNPLSYVVLNNQNGNIAQATAGSGSTLTLKGIAAGTDIITICATGGGCAPVTVTVTGSATTPAPTPTTPTPVTPTPTPTTPVVTVPQTGGSVVASAAIIAKIQALQSAVSQALAQIQSIQSQLNQLAAQVSAGGISTGGSSAGASGSFTELLAVGTQSDQVTLLQQQLTTLGFYSGPISGFYGTLTASAVSKYQTAHGISATGSVGPATRAALNAGN